MRSKEITQKMQQDEQKKEHDFWDKHIENHKASERKK